MKSDQQPAYILGSSRTPFVKSQTSYSEVTRKELMVAALNGLVERFNLKGVLVGDTALGAVMNSSADFNLARECILDTELHPESPAVNIQRACGTSLEAVWQIGMKLHTGAIDIGIAGGVDTNSDLPIEISKTLQGILLRLNKARTFSEKVGALKGLHLGNALSVLLPKIPNVNEPRTLLSMGQHCELMVKEWKITREEQDMIALNSHKNGAKAYAEGFYRDLVQPFKGLETDGTLRANTSMEQLAKLKPAFDPKAGTLTAGNSSPLTDGSACVLMANERGVDRLGRQPLARLIDAQVAAVDFVHGAGLLMAPTKAIAQILRRNRLTFADFDFIEIHEAFAGQVLCNLKAMESDDYCRTALGEKSALGAIDRKKLNTVGSSIALGHPFAATGARITGTLAKLLSQAGTGKRGLISICTAGGMGVVAILES